MNYSKSILLSSFMLIATGLYAQEETTSEEAAVEPSFSIAGSVDTYYRSSEYAPGTSFGNLPGFSLGMANLVTITNKQTDH